MNTDEQFERFVDANHLYVKVVRRPNWGKRGRWFVHIAGAEVEKQSYLTLEFGMGLTVKEAIADYIEKIKGYSLVLNSSNKKKKRRVVFSVKENVNG